MRRQTVAGAKQPPGGRTSGFERSAVTGGKLIRHAAQQSMQQGNGSKILFIQSAEHSALRRILPCSGERRAELRHIVRHGSLERAEHGGVGGRAGGSRDQLGRLAEKTLQQGKAPPAAKRRAVSSQPPGKGRVSSPGTVRCSFVKNENWLPVPMFISGASSRPCPAPRKLA